MPFTKYTFIISALLLGMVYSCKDKTPEPSGCAAGTPCQSVLVSKEFFLFKPGSYWVYEEENSHVRDSLYVYSYANGSDYTFQMIVISALDDYRYAYWPEYYGQADKKCSKTAPVDRKCLFVRGSKFIPGSQQGNMDLTALIFQYRVNDSTQSSSDYYVNNRIKISDIMSESYFGYAHFGETVKVFNQHNIFDKNHPTNYYYAKGVGLVRKELTDTAETWNLVNYYIAP